MQASSSKIGKSYEEYLFNFKVIQFQESNLLRDKPSFNYFLCEKTMNKVRYEKLLAAHVLGEDLVATKERLYKAQAVNKSTY